MGVVSFPFDVKLVPVDTHVCFNHFSTKDIFRTKSMAFLRLKDRGTMGGKSEVERIISVIE